MKECGIKEFLWCAATALAVCASTSAQSWNWTLVTNPGAIPPSSRASHGMAYDSGRSRTVVFGGQTQTGGVNETWEFDGATWTQMTPVVAPSARSAPELIYDTMRSRVVMFGGRRTTVLDETWCYDGTTWTQLLPTQSPPPRSFHAMSYDRLADRIVVFGGWTGQTGGLLNDTWEFDGSNWQQIATTTRRGTSCSLVATQAEQPSGQTTLGDTPTDSQRRPRSSESVAAPGSRLR